MQTTSLIARQVARLGRREIETISHDDRIDRIARPLQAKVRAIFKTRAGRPARDFLNGTWLGHPLHPVLTDIPIGAWTTATVLDAVTATGRANLDRGARVSLTFGIVGAVGAALTGLADWSETGKEPRRIGLVHATLNTTALVLQLVSLIGRGRSWRPSKLFSLLGLAVASSAAYLGGNLVYRLGTQVDRTAWSGGLRNFRPAIAASDLPQNQPARAVVDGVPILLVRREDQVFALEDTCGHAGCPLSQGRLEGETIVCACHGSTYRLTDGAVLRGPSPFPQPTFEVQIEGGEISLRRRPV